MKPPRRFSAARRAAGALALVLAITPVAAAAPTFLPQVPVSAVGEDTMFQNFVNQVAMNARGDAAIAWTVPTGTSTKVRAAIHPVGGSWTVADVSPVGDAVAAFAPIALSADGTVHALWARTVGADSRVEYAIRAPGSSAWSPPVLVQTSTNPAGGLDLSVTASGEVLATWSRGGGPSAEMFAAAAPTGGVFTVSPDLAGNTSGPPQIAANGAGAGVATWREFSGAAFRLRPAFRVAGGSWATQALISADTNIDVDSPQVGIDSAGNALALWVQGVTGQTARIRFATRPAATGTWSAIQALSAAGQSASQPSLAMNASGEAVATWLQNDGVNPDEVMVATLGAGGSWSTLPAIGVGSQPRAAINDAGDSMVVFTQADIANNLVRAVTRKAGETFGAPVTISATSGVFLTPDVALNAAGDGAVGFQRLPPPNPVIAVGYDVSGPIVDPVDFPASGFASIGFPYNLFAKDVWSLIPSTQWIFGDGTNALGNAGSKTYAAPGSYGANVTVTDAVGNATSVSRSITIGPPPDVTGPKLSKGSVSLGRIKVTSTEAGTVLVEIARALPGKRVGGKCLKPTSKNRLAKNCTRFPLLRKVRVVLRLGANNFKIPGTKLKPGRYRVSLTGRDGVGNVGKLVRTAIFTVK